MLVVVLLAVVGAAASSPCGTDPSESHVLFHNERVRILDWRIRAGSKANASNTVPTVRWRIVSPTDKIPLPVFYEAGTCAFVSASEAQRHYVFEILQKPRYLPAEVQKLLGAPNYTTAVGSQMWLENEYVRMWDFHSPVGMDLFHQHVFDYAFVVCSNDQHVRD